VEKRRHLRFLPCPAAVSFGAILPDSPNDERYRNKLSAGEPVKLDPAAVVGDDSDRQSSLIYKRFHSAHFEAAMQNAKKQNPTGTLGGLTLNLPNGICFETYVDDASTNITGYADSVYHGWLCNKANSRTSKIRTGYTRKVEAV
jgi:hypothetical protein